MWFADCGNYGDSSGDSASSMLMIPITGTESGKALANATIRIDWARCRLLRKRTKFPTQCSAQACQV
jgi:hypothetical protein